jgi:hypothetical protein
MLVVTVDVGGEQPHHVVAQFAVLTRRQGEMEMVGHQTKGKEVHGEAFAGVAQELDESGEVAILVEDGLAAVAPIEDVGAIAAFFGPSGAGWPWPVASERTQRPG